MQGNSKKEYRNFSKIVNTFYNEEIENISEEEIDLKDKGTIKLEPKILYDKFTGNMKIEFLIRKNKIYKIKNLAEFYTKMMNKENFKYREGLQFVHDKESFTDESKPLLEFLLKYAEIMKYTNSNSNSNYKYFGKALNENSIIIGNNGIDEIFDILKNQEVNFQKDGKEEKVKFIEENPKIEFDLKKTKADEYVILPNTDIYKIILIKGKSYKYILDKDKLYRCTKDFEETNIKLLEVFRQNYISEVDFSKKELTQFFSIIMPKMKNSIKIKDISENDLEQYKPKHLEVKVFLDYDKFQNIVADIRFKYGKEEFNPLDESIKIDFPRNIIEETKALNIFRKTGFMFEVKKLRFILPDVDKIYKFMIDDINLYMKKFQVLVTDNFRTKQIKQPKIGSIRIKAQNDLLSINLNDLNIDISQIKEIMERYHLKKKYYRLKDGSFLKLQDNQEIDFLDKLITGADVSYKDLEKGEINLPVNRTLYLNTILGKLKSTAIIKNDTYKNIVNSLNKDVLNEMELPQLNTTLRYYQKIGFKWLKLLDDYKFGGILADDMGLGKTVQILAIILDYILRRTRK